MTQSHRTKRYEKHKRSSRGGSWVHRLVSLMNAVNKIKWRDRDTTTTLGYLDCCGDDLTLFIIEPNDGRYNLAGAFIPDSEEPFIGSMSEVKLKAQEYIDLFLEKIYAGVLHIDRENREKIISG